jgi:hypothetical protein
MIGVFTGKLRFPGFNLFNEFLKKPHKNGVIEHKICTTLHLLSISLKNFQNSQFLTSVFASNSLLMYMGKFFSNNTEFRYG